MNRYCVTSPILIACLGKSNEFRALIDPGIGQSRISSYTVSRLCMYRPVSTCYIRMLFPSLTVMLQHSDHNPRIPLPKGRAGQRKLRMILGCFVFGNGFWVQLSGFARVK